MNQTINSQFHLLLKKFETDGIESSPRGLAVKELELESLAFNPNFPIPNFEARPFNWKYFLGEMAWYLKQDRKINYINNFSSFWKTIVDEEGNINSNYGNLLFGEQLQWAYDSLTKDKNTRQAISFVSRVLTSLKTSAALVYLPKLRISIRNFLRAVSGAVKNSRLDAFD